MASGWLTGRLQSSSEGDSWQLVAHLPADSGAGHAPGTTAQGTELPGRGEAEPGWRAWPGPRGAAQRLPGPRAPAGLPRVSTGLSFCIWKLGQHLCCRLPGSCASEGRRRAGGQVLSRSFQRTSPWFIYSSLPAVFFQKKEAKK